MSGLSKTARAAMRAGSAGEQQKQKVRTTEEIIRDLRNNRASHLHVSPTDVDVLLAEYDALQVKAALLLEKAIGDKPIEISVKPADGSVTPNTVNSLMDPLDQVTVGVFKGEPLLVAKGVEPVQLPGQQEHQVIIDAVMGH